MLHTEHITEHSPILAQLEALYERAFPANERRPLGPLLHDPSGRGEVLAFYDGPLFCGFACLLTDGDITHIIYFAIDDALRARGYGSAALAAMRQMYPGHRILVDIEDELPDAPNNDQRKRRRRFYTRNGYAPSGVKYRWRGDSYEILSHGGDVTKSEFNAFWRHIGAQNRVLTRY